MKRILSIVGPTASGKSRLSVALAKEYDAEIVSLDSMQIYRQMNIGTAKISAEEMSGIPHHMIDCVDISENYNVQRFVTEARKCIDDIVKRKNCILVGGTGLYLEHLISDTHFADMPNDPELRENLDKFSEHQLFELLKECDPVSANRLHFNDKKRVMRAIEVYRLTGKTIGYWDEISHKDSIPLDALKIGLYFNDRNELYERINRRVDDMIHLGLEREVRNLLLNDGFMNSTASDAIGYKEMISYINGNCSLDQAIEQIKLNTRHFAKRQYTWFRRYNDIHWIPVSDDFDAVITAACGFLKGF